MTDLNFLQAKDTSAITTPELVTTGVNKPTRVTNSSLVDWVSLTYKSSNYQWKNMGTNWKPTKPQFGYQYGMLSQEGIIGLFSGADYDMGTHLIYPGSALNQISNVIKLLHDHLDAGARITRLDVAVDVYDDNLTPKLLYKQRREMVTKAKKYKLMTGTDGDTMYIGSRTSEKYMRIYDKNAEQGIKNAAIARTRIEIETKGYTAHALAHYLVTNGLGAIPEIICGFADFPKDRYWRKAMQECKAHKIASERKMTNTEEWLLNTVSQTIADYCVEHEGFYQRFIAEINRRIDGRADTTLSEERG